MQRSTQSLGLSSFKKGESSLMGLNQHGSSRTSRLPRVYQLLDHFNSISNDIDIDINKANFNLIEYDGSSSKKKYDPAAKLRKLQNKAEIKIADMELDRRRKKNKYLPINPYKNIENRSYLDTYLQYSTRRPKMIDSDDEDEELTVKNHQNGVSFYRELKKLPKIFEHTIKKRKDRENSENNSRQKMMEIKTQIKRESNNPQAEQGLLQLFKQEKKNHEYQKKNNPEQVIDSQLRKLYSSKDNEKVTDKAKKSPRCVSLMHKQQQILSELDEKVISKDSIKKLRLRFNELVNQIGKHALLPIQTHPKQTI